ncbi:MAG: hypothetical protein Q9162_002095 [Coniocarpon cinnabarinum]
MASLLDSDPSEDPPVLATVPIAQPSPSHTPRSRSPVPLSHPSNVNDTDKERVNNQGSPPLDNNGLRWQQNFNGVSQRASNYLSYPVKQTLSSAWRRLSSQDVIPSLSTHTASSLTSSAVTSPLSPTPNGTFTPPRRHLTPPFQPPPLTPLTLSGYKSPTRPDARLLARSVAEEIRLLIPPRLQLMNEWRLAFSLDQDGSSLSTLYSACNSPEFGGSSSTTAAKNQGGFVMVVKDSLGGIFGAYLTDPPKPSAGHYYGHGECFLWRAAVLPQIPTLGDLPPPPSEDTTHATRSTTTVLSNRTRPLGAGSTANGNGLLNPNSLPGSGATTPRSGISTPERIRFKAFPYSGENDYLIFCEQGFFSIGGGDGHYGLWLDDSLDKGISQTCPTFGNEPLSEESEQGGTGAGKGSFEILGVECWWVG